MNASNQVVLRKVIQRNDHSLAIGKINRCKVLIQERNESTAASIGEIETEQSASFTRFTVSDQLFLFSGKN